MITIGYGDITPENTYERLFSISMEFLATCVFGYAMNSIMAIIDLKNEEIAHLKRSNSILNKYKKLKNSYRRYMK